MGDAYLMLRRVPILERLGVRNRSWGCLEYTFWSGWGCATEIGAAWSAHFRAAGGAQPELGLLGVRILERVGRLNLNWGRLGYTCLSLFGCAIEEGAGGRTRC